MLGRADHWDAGRDDDIDLALNELGGKCKATIDLSLVPSKFQEDVPSFHVPKVTQSLPERLH